MGAAPLAEGFKLDRSNVGRSIGGGCWKTCYELLHHEHEYVVLTGSCVPEERDRLQKLAQLECPSAQYEATGEFTDGWVNPAGLMKRYVFGNKGIFTGKQLYETLNEKTIESTRQILKAIETHRLYIGDMQYLFGEDGSMVIADPLDVIPSAGEYHWFRGSAVHEMDRWAWGAEYAVAVRKGLASPVANQISHRSFWEAVKEWKSLRKETLRPSSRK